MKIRTSYVSNSSSSSFVLVGYVLEDESKDRFFQIAKKIDPELLSHYETVEDLVYDVGYTVENWKASIVVKAGAEYNGLEEGKTFVGYYISPEGYTIIDIGNVKEGLSDFETFLQDEEKKLKVVTGTEEC